MQEQLCDSSQSLANQPTNACVLYKSGVTPLSGWICLWNVGHLGLSAIRSFITRAIGPRLTSHIYKLRHRVQKSGSRHDLIVNPKYAARILKYLRNQTHLAGWHVRMHIPYPERSKARYLRSPSFGKGIASWNVNSLKGKRDEIAWYLSKEGIAILALQETLHKSEDWRMRLGKYQCIESPMQEGKVGERGVALAIAPHLIAHETGSHSPFWIWARIIHPTFPTGLIVGSVYVISHKGKERQEMIKGLKASTKSILSSHPNSPVIIMGDWNMDSQELSSMLKDWRLPLSCLDCRGSPRTRWKGSGSLRDLDHIIVSTNAYSKGQKCPHVFINLL